MSKAARRRRVIKTILVILVIPPSALAMLSLLSKKPQNLGARDGRLAPCPDTPNCVASQAGDPRHAIPALSFRGSADAAMERLRRVLRDLPHTTIASAQDDYIHAESRTRIFRFVDDLEFLVDRRENLIHVRAASRVGYSDLGANRTRVETIRFAFERLAQLEQRCVSEDQ